MKATNLTVDGVRGLANLSFLDVHPQVESLRSNVLSGLGKMRKEIASKFLYDEAGSELFDKICDQPEYYQTAAELEILDRHAAELVAGPGPMLLVEFGSGHSRKVRKLIPHLGPGASYVSIDISRDYLLAHAERIASDFPNLQVVAICADFLQPLTLPLSIDAYAQCIAYFPGSTLGNFEPTTQRCILANIRAILGKGGSMLIGMDRKNALTTLEAAYNDAAGVTAAFELNLLRRINRELGGNFAVDKFTYEGCYNAAASRIEMNLVSQCEQAVTIDGQMFHFAAGEPLHVENSYKYEPTEFAAFCCREGLELRKFWTDEREQFVVYRTGLMTPVADADYRKLAQPRELPGEAAYGLRHTDSVTAPSSADGSIIR